MDSNEEDNFIYDGDLSEPDERNNIESDTDIEIIAEIPGRAMEVEVKEEAIEDVLNGSDTGRETPKNEKAARRRRSDERDAITPVSMMKRLRLHTPAISSDSDCASISASVSDAGSAVDAREVYLEKKMAVHMKIVLRIGMIAMENASRVTSVTSDGEKIGAFAEQCLDKILKEKNWKINRLVELDRNPNISFCSNVLTMLVKAKDVSSDPTNSKLLRDLMEVLKCYLNYPFLSPMEKRTVSSTPTHQPFSFAKWSDSNGDLHLREVARVDDIGQPLGGAFDAHEGFLFTCGGTIRCCSETGENSRVLVKNIENPSAIAVIKSGERFCFLDDEGIQEYNWYEKRSEIVALVNNARGLVYMDGGMLITAARKSEKREWRLCVYDANKFNRQLSFTYHREGRPSFMSSYKNTLFFTDLETRSLTTYELNDHFVLVPQKMISLESTSIPKSFRYPSGIAVDRRREVIIADAHVDDGFLMWGSAKLDEWKIVKMSRPFPYTAAISISPGGYLLAATRHSNGIKIFRFVEEPDGMDNA